MSTEANKVIANADNASVRAEQLEALFEAMADAVFVYASAGHLLQANKAAHDLFGFDGQPDDPTLSQGERVTAVELRDHQEQPPPQEPRALVRVLGSKVLTGTTTLEVRFLRIPMRSTSRRT
jgi:PAS domain-containing protein